MNVAIGGGGPPDAVTIAADPVTEGEIPWETAVPPVPRMGVEEEAEEEEGEEEEEAGGATRMAVSTEAVLPRLRLMSGNGVLAGEAGPSEVAIRGR